MSAISTHVLDTSVGRPAAGVAVTLEIQSAGIWRELARGTTSRTGASATCSRRARQPERGLYRLSFDTGVYFEAQGVRASIPASASSSTSATRPSTTTCRSCSARSATRPTGGASVRRAPEPAAALGPRLRRDPLDRPDLAVPVARPPLRGRRREPGRPRLHGAQRRLLRRREAARARRRCRRRCTGSSGKPASPGSPAWVCCCSSTTAASCS